MNLRFFGIDWPISAGKIGLPADGSLQLVGINDSKYIAATGMANFDIDARRTDLGTRLVFKGSFKCETFGGGLRPELGREVKLVRFKLLGQNAQLGNGAQVSVSLGWFSTQLTIADPASARMVASEADVRIETRANFSKAFSFREDSDYTKAPLAFSWVKAAPAFTLSWSPIPRVTVESGAIEAEAGVRLNGYDDNRLPVRWTNKDKFSVTAENKGSVLAFLVRDSGKPLVLHPSARLPADPINQNNPLRSPLISRDADLRIGVRLAESGPTAVQVSRLALCRIPGITGRPPWTIAAETLFDSLNQRVTLKPKDTQELPLLARLVDVKTVGGLLVGPGSIECKIDNAVPGETDRVSVHGPLSGVIFQLPRIISLGATTLCRASGGNGACLPVANDHPLFSGEALAQETFPILTTGTNATFSVNRPGVGFEGNGASTLKFDGPGYAVPLIQDVKHLYGPEGWARDAYEALDTAFKAMKAPTSLGNHDSGYVEKPTELALAPTELFKRRVSKLGALAPAALATASMPAARANSLAVSMRVNNDLVIKEANFLLVFGPITVTVRRGGSGLAEDQQYSVLRTLDKLVCVDYEGSPGTVHFAVDQGFGQGSPSLLNAGGEPQGVPSKHGHAFAVVKFGRGITLKEIFVREKIDLEKIFPQRMDATDDDPGEPEAPKDSGEQFDRLFDRNSPINAPDWTGIVLLRVQVASNDPVLVSVLPENLELAYVAFSAPERKAADSTVDQKRFPSTYARVLWRPPPELKDEAFPANNESKETQFKLTKVDLRVVETQLVYVDIRSQLKFARFLGIQQTNSQAAFDSDQVPKFSIRGTLERRGDKAEIVFLGNFPRPLPLFVNPDGSERPLKEGLVEQIWFKGARISSFDGRAAVSIDGRLQPRTPEGLGSNLSLSSIADFVDWAGLRIYLGKAGKGGGRWLDLSYPAINFDFSKRAYKLANIPGFNISLAGLGIDWDGVWDWSSLMMFNPSSPPSGTLAARRILFDIDLDLCDLPSIAMGGMKRLVLRLRLGYQIKGLNFDGSPFVALSALHMEPFSIGLASFLQIKADCVKYFTRTTGVSKTSGINAQNLRVSVLSTELIRNIYLEIFSNSTTEEKGFLAMYSGNPEPITNDSLAEPGSPGSDCKSDVIPVEPKQGSSNFEIDWFLLGQNVTIEEKALKALISVPKTTAGAIADGDVDDMGKKPGGQTWLKRESIMSGEQAGLGWIVGAGVSVLGDFFKGRFIFQDRKYYGLALYGDAFEEWTGKKLGVSILYIDRGRGASDSFFGTLLLPALGIGTVEFTGGVVEFEWFLNGDFYFDAGFPKLVNGIGRDWGRALGAIITPFQGSGGVYIAKRTSVVKGMDKNIRLSMGYAVQGGLGATFNAGIIRAWVTVGVYVIAEGDIVIDTSNQSLRGLRITGALGVLIRGGALLEVWVISVRFEVTVGAEIRSTISWGVNENCLPWHEAETGTPPPICAPTDSRIRIELAFELYVVASGRACIGGGWCRICKSVSARLNMPVKYTMVLG